MADIVLRVLILYGMFCTVFLTIVIIYGFFCEDRIYKNLKHDINVLEYLNNDMCEIKQVIERLRKEIQLDLIKNKKQLRQRFSELVISYGYVPKLDLKITKQIKE